MIKTALTAIRYYTQADPYFYTVDNRPLQDLEARDNQLYDELDRRVITLDVTGAATPVLNHVPAGWTVAVNGAGDYTITHNLGDTNYIAVGQVVDTNGGNVFTVAFTTTTLQIKTTNLAGVATHLRFQLHVSRFN